MSAHEYLPVKKGYEDTKWSTAHCERAGRDARMPPSLAFPKYAEVAPDLSGRPRKHALVWVFDWVHSTFPHSAILQRRKS